MRRNLSLHPRFSSGQRQKDSQLYGSGFGKLIVPAAAAIPIFVLLIIAQTTGKVKLRFFNPNAERDLDQPAASLSGFGHSFSSLVILASGSLLGQLLYSDPRFITSIFLPFPHFFVFLHSFFFTIPFTRLFGFRNVVV